MACEPASFSSREVLVQQIGRCSFTSIAAPRCDTGDYLIGVVNHQTHVDIAKRHGLDIAGIPLEMNVSMSMCFRPNVFLFCIEPYASSTSAKSDGIKSNLFYMNIKKMDTQDGLSGIREQLTETKEFISSIFKNKIEKIENKEIKDKFQHYKDTEVERVKLEIDQCIKTIDSPVFVGLLGRYSHGKTALVNSLFSLDDEHRLVEGDGVVTSKITRVEFSNSIYTSKCFECYRSGEQIPIDITTLQTSVSGKTPMSDNSIIEYYYIKLPANKPFSQMFEKKLISLIDMPGLGGPYFKDTEKTKKYVENLDMLLVIMKISEIDQAARVIEPYIAGMGNKNIPMIPVITFFDKWRDSPKFTDCTTDEDVFGKVREQIGDYAPSLLRHMVRTIVVSSKDGFQIDNLRELILNFVESQSFAIEKIRKESSDVFKRKLREIQKTLESLVIKAERSIDLLRKNIETMLPEKGDLQSFSKNFEKHKDKSLKDAKLKISRASKDIFSNFKDKTNDIRYKNTYPEIYSAVEKLTIDINKGAVRDLTEQLDSIFLEIKEKIEENLNRYIDKLELASGSREILKEKCIDILKSCQMDVENIAYTPPEIATNQASDYTKTVVEVIINSMKSPQFLIPIVLGVGLITGVSIPFTNINFPEIGFILIAGSVISSLFLDNSAKKKNFNQSKNNIIEKVIGSFDRQKMEDQCNEKLFSTTKDLLDEVDDALGDEISQHGKDLKNVKEISKEFKSKIEDLNKYLSREIEKLEVSRG